MLVYLEPALLEHVSPTLRGRMQRKSCFNFTRLDEALFNELAVLTQRGRELFADRGLLRNYAGRRRATASTELPGHQQSRVQDRPLGVNHAHEDAWSV